MALAYESALQALIHHSFKLVGTVSIHTCAFPRRPAVGGGVETQAITGIK